MPFIDFYNKKKIRIMPGVQGSLAHSDQLTFGRFSISKGAVIPQHSHPHEQWTHLLYGTLEFIIENEKCILEEGMAAYIPSGSIHSAIAITDCMAIDCFFPVREDFKEFEALQNAT